MHFPLLLEQALTMMHPSESHRNRNRLMQPICRCWTPCGARAPVCHLMGRPMGRSAGVRPSGSCGRDDGDVKRSTAINRLADVADALDRTGQWPGPKVVAAYVFGVLLDPVSELEAIQLALVVDEPPEELAWLSRPARLEALASLCRFDKLPLSWRWRPAAWTVWNHEISRAVRFWSSGEGRDEAVLRALADARVDGLRFDQPGGPEQMARQLTIERDVSRGHLAAVKAQFYDRDWRREHSRDGTHPEDHLWWATAGYLDLDDAIAALDG